MKRRKGVKRWATTVPLYYGYRLSTGMAERKLKYHSSYKEALSAVGYSSQLILDLSHICRLCNQGYNSTLHLPDNKQVDLSGPLPVPGTGPDHWFID